MHENLETSLIYQTVPLSLVLNGTCHTRFFSQTAACTKQNGFKWVLKEQAYLYTYLSCNSLFKIGGQKSGSCHPVFSQLSASHQAVISSQRNLSHAFFLSNRCVYQTKWVEINSEGVDIPALLKFIYSEMATKFCEISTNYLSYAGPSLPVK